MPGKPETERQPVIGIVGLGSIGRSLGLALQGIKTSYEIVGHDPEPDRVRLAKESGAVDRTHWNLIEVAEAADLLFLTEPESATVRTLEAIADSLKPRALVTDVLPMKRAVLDAADANLPDNVSFVGGHPVVPWSLEEASADIFSGATYCIVPHPNAEDDAVSTMTRLVKAIGSEPYFISAEEHDALSLAVGPVPFLLAAAVLRVAAASPSARDLRRLAGPGFGLTLDTAKAGAAYAEALRAGPSELLAWLDAVVDQIQGVRDAVAKGDYDTLADFLEQTTAAREQWDAAVETVERSAAFKELDERNVVAETLFGRLGRPRHET